MITITDDKSFVLGKQFIIIFLIISLILGFTFGYLYVYHSSIKSSDERIDYAENRMMELEYFLPSWGIIGGGDTNFISVSNMTLLDARELYFRYRITSRYLLGLEIDNLCGIVKE